tara:strand:- start:1942 stop:2373 length:432 start_codon:yes stop_codon:yes gene_type:complete
MKNLFLLLFIPLVFACSDDDSNEESGSIEGRWYLTEYYEDGEELILEECDLESYMDLSDGGTGEYYLYYTDGPPDPCGLDIIYSLDYYSVPNTVNIFSITIDFGNGSYSIAEGVLEGNTLRFTGVDVGGENDGVDFITIYTRD